MNSKKEALKPFGITPNFIESWFKPFKMNYENQTEIICEEMLEMFHKIPVVLPKPVGYIKKR